MATDKSFGCRFANTEKCADSCFKCELFHRDYISREAALSCFSDWIDCYGHEHSADEMTEYQRIEELPVADVRPVVRARWEDATGYIFSNLAQRVHCPVCKSYAYFHAIMPRNYCPNCGAEMGVQKDD